MTRDMMVVREAVTVAREFHQLRRVLGLRERGSGVLTRG